MLSLSKRKKWWMTQNGYFGAAESEHELDEAIDNVLIFKTAGGLGSKRRLNSKISIQ